MKNKSYSKNTLFVLFFFGLSFHCINGMNLFKKITPFIGDIDINYEIAKAMAMILFDKEDRKLSDRAIAYCFLYMRYGIPSSISIISNNNQQYRITSLINKAIPSIIEHFNLENVNFYKKFFIHKKTNPIVDDCFKKIIERFGNNPKENIFVQKDSNGQAITNTVVIESTNENMTIEENSTLGYQLYYNNQVHTDIRKMIQYIFVRLNLYHTYNTINIFLLPDSDQLIGAASTDLGSKTCSIYVKEIYNINPLNLLHIFDSLIIHEFSHIQHNDSSISNELFNTQRASEFQAESWIPEDFKSLAKIRFYGKIITFGNILNKIVSSNTFYPAPLERYFLSRTMYKENFDDPELFYADLENIHPALVQLDNILMNLYEKHKNNMFIAPKLIEDIRAAKQELVAQQYEYGYGF